MEPPPPDNHQTNLDATEFQPLIPDDPSSSSLFDWGDLLDFTVDDHLLISFGSPDPHLQDTPPDAQLPERVRKRDPRLTCSNFLAGRIPCACPEIDEKLLEEEEEEGECGPVVPGKKRARVTRVGAGTAARCQVTGCEADISELKGYHKRHRVCLRCANATAVMFEGETKRYCQQCGKFHLLCDFDDGKRSCRRKLERHNNRRRRKPIGSKSSLDREPQVDVQTDYVACVGEEGKKDGQMGEKVTIELEDGRASSLHSAPSSSQNLNNSDCGAASVETLMDCGKDDSKFSLSPSCGDTKSAYSSMCPTGRISFKLYDWNPAEFPRRLRHQIFQWLASMPVELEGYIRPGCTILTSFIAMPTFMWRKLFEDPIAYMHDFVIVPGKMLSRKGPMLIYLNDMVFHVLRDGTSIMRVKMEGQAPRLHYVHPMYFEAGRPIEFVACGSNLLQPKFRLLVSFAGKYLDYNFCTTSSPGQTEGSSSLEHQLCKIIIPHNEPNLFGPAFIEVENESGLSNFIPILIGDRRICSEMETIHKRFVVSHLSDGSQCEVLASRQLALSEFVADVAWLLREPPTENVQIMSSSQIQRCNSLLKFLIYHESTTILYKIIENLKIMMDKMEVVNSGINDSCDADLRLLQNYMDYTNGILNKKLNESEGLTLQLEYVVQERECFYRSSSEIDVQSISDSEDLEKTPNFKSLLMASSTTIDKSGMVKLLDREDITSANLVRGRMSTSCSHMLSTKVLKSRPTIFVIVIVAVCFGVCAVLLHPSKVSRFAVSIRRCLIDEF